MKNVFTKLILISFWVSLSQVIHAQLACNNLVNVSIEPSTCEALITADMMLEGGPYDYNNMTVAPSVLTAFDLGVETVVTVTETTTSNTCWGKILLEDPLGNCTFAGDCTLRDELIDAPDESIDIYVDDINDVDLSIENLQIQFGLSPTHVEVLVPQICDNIVSSYNDISIDESASLRKVLRKFTILDWNTSSQLERTQVINIHHSSDVLLSVGSVTGNCGDVVCLPINVTGFTRIESFSTSVTWSDADLEYAEVRNISLPMFTEQSNMNTANSGMLALSWFDATAIAPVTIDAGAKLIDVCFTIIADASNVISDVSLTHDLAPISISQTAGGPFQPSLALTYSALDGTVSVLSGCTPGSLVCNDHVFVSVDPWSCTATISPEMILAGGPYNYDNMALSESLLGLGEHDIVVTDTINNNACWGRVTVEDKTPPVVVTQEKVVTVLQVDANNPNGFVRVSAEDIDNGSYDSCSGVTFSPEYYEFTCADLGIQTVVLTIGDDNGNVNSATAEIQILGMDCDFVSDLVCNEAVIASVDPWSCEVTISPEMLLEGGPYNYANMILSESLLELGEHTVTVTDSTTGSSCWSTVFIEDKSPPVVVAIQNIVVRLLVDASHPNGYFRLYAEDLDNGSYDGCSEVTLSPEYYELSCADLGMKSLDLIVTDAEGNSNSTFVNVRVEGEDCGLSGTLVCNNQVEVSAVPWDCQATISPATVLASGGNVSSLQIEPTQLTELNVPVVYTVTNTQTGDTCWGTVTLVDNTPPITVVNNYIVISLIENPATDELTAKLYADQVDNGSHDGDCGPVRLEPEFWRFDCGDIGLQEVVLRVYDDADGDGVPGSSDIDNYSEAWALVELELKLNEAIACPPDVVVSCSVDISDESVIENILGRPSLNAGCESNSANYRDQLGFDQNDDGDLDDTYVGPNGIVISEQFSPCHNNAILRTWSFGDSDCVQNIYVELDQLFDSSTIVWPIDSDSDCELDTGVPTWEASDCNLIGWNLSSDTLLFESDACRKIINVWTVIDWCAYDASDITGPGFYTHTSIQSISDTAVPEITASADLTINCQADNISLTATASDQCELGMMRWLVSIDYQSDFAIDRQIELSSAVNEPVTIDLDEIADGTHTVSWSVYDACGNTSSEITVVTVNNDSTVDVQAPTPYCLNLSTLVISGGVGEVWAIDFDQGSFDNCVASENLRFTFSDVAPSSDPDYNVGNRSSSKEIVVSDIGADGLVDLRVYVWDTADNSDFCQVSLSVVTVDGCDESSVEWPNDIIEINATVNNAASIDFIDPESLVNVFGFTTEEVRPTYPSACEFLDSYHDDVFVLGNNEYKIIRMWTVLDWFYAETYEQAQVIKISNAPTYICDFLPNTAPIGDCQSGHTLDDDVEWPADIAIDDHRIAPDELETFSAILAKDSGPVFPNTPELYNVIYEDFVDDLTPEALVIRRKWSVNRDWVTGFVWTYDQYITLDLEGLTGLVSVNTMHNRPVSEVSLTPEVMTDGTGIGFVDQSDEVMPYLKGSAINGLNIKDLFLIRNHILGIDGLEFYEMMAADYNNDNTISGIDLVTIQQEILGITQTEVEWIFDKIAPVSGLPTKGQYIGIKPGDVDDSAILTGDPITYDETSLVYKDILINAGESYALDFNFLATKRIWGVEVRMTYDAADLTITNVTSTAFENIQYHAANGILSIVGLSNAGVLAQLDSDPVFVVEFDALVNTTLSTSLDFADDAPSYILPATEELLILKGEIQDQLSSGTTDTAYGQISVYPNPVSEVLNIELPTELASQFEFRIYDLTGRVVVRTANQKNINITAIAPGTYIYELQSQNIVVSDKIIIMR